MTTESIRRQPPKSNTAMVVFLTVLGTVVVLAGAGGIFWFLGNQNSGGNQNVNYNTNFNSVDINLNTNLAVSNSLANFSNNTNNSNSSANLNANANINSNANLKTPTPTVTPSRTPTVTPSPTPEEVETDVEINPNTNISLPSPTPTPRPSNSPSPRDTPSAAPANRPVNAGVLNGRAVNLPKPAYPQAAKQMRADGQVAVQVMVDEAGNVISAKATSGNALLRPSAEAAARQSKFNPIKVRDQAVKASGFVIYNFVN